MNERDPVTDTATDTHPDPSPETADDWISLRERIETASRQAHDHRVAYEAELERRDRLVLHAFDHALASPSAIAAAARISVTQVYRICSV